VLLISGAIAAVVVLILLVVVPVGGDASAHFYRTFLVQHGTLLWDNLWFAGQYPLVSYSLFYYLPAALIGNAVLGAAGVMLSALLFASILLHAYGLVARWPSYVFAFAAGGQLFTGDYPYTVGFAALLATVWALQRGRTVLAVTGAALTLGCSPLAFLFLCLTLLALLFATRPPRMRAVAIAVTIGLLVAIEFGALALFPSHDLYYPFTPWRLALGVPVGVLGSAIALRNRAARPLASVFIIWTAATVVAFFVRSPVGHNLLRPATLVFPLMLLIALLGDFKPRPLVMTALAAAFAANFLPYSTTIAARADSAGRQAFWTPMLAYIDRHQSPDFRLEVVPTINHWEAYFVPRYGYAIARGWYQQLDNGDNPSLNGGHLTGPVYRTWLRSRGVRYVIAPRDAAASGSVPEMRLLRGGRSGLVRVLHSPTGDIYELPHATPLLTGPGHTSIVSQTHQTLTGSVSRSGAYLLRVHYTPFWQLRSGALCIRPSTDGMTQLEVQRPGRFSLRAMEGIDALIDIVFRENPSRSLLCRSHSN
jgi:hypothetical protein